jgi:hypothetical protein
VVKVSLRGLAGRLAPALTVLLVGAPGFALLTRTTYFRRAYAARGAMRR